MFRCETCQDRLLDRLYGLLDPAEAAEVDAHLAGCPACTTAAERAGRWQGLIARAAKSEFPDVRFIPPAEPASPAPKSVDPVVPAPARRVQGTWIRWAVAASLFLAYAALAGPTTRDLVGYWVTKPRVDRELAAAEQAKAEYDRLAAALERGKEASDRRLADARQKHDDLVAEWVKAEEAGRAGKPFAVRVSGPVSAIPGAPNKYDIQVVGRDGKPSPAVAVTAQVTDAAGTVLLEQQYPADGKPVPKPLHLPPQMWARVKRGGDLKLTVTATDPKGGARDEVTETIPLLDPVFTTYLATDKPLYRPGETVYFRSVTLDRARFLPPDHDLTLRFELVGPDGKPIPGQEVAGLAMPVRAGRGAPADPVLGPDGKPVRGVGTGMFALPAGPGGVYEIRVYQAGPGGERVGNSLPLAVRKILVNRYTPDKLEKKLEFDGKSYGPGDVVQAKVEVLDQGKPRAGMKLAYELRVVFDDGTTPEKAPTLDVAPGQTDRSGAAAVRFTLPAKGDLGLREASLTVTVTAPGAVETIVRQIPVVSRRLTVEFFPEGGDLVTGVPNRVYVRATTAQGKPADIDGVLTDGAKDVCAVKTLTDPDHPGANQGLGVFTFTPEAGTTYSVRLNRPVGVVPPKGGYRLPEAKLSGLVLAVPNGIDRTGDKGRGTLKVGEKIPVRLWTSWRKRAVLVGAYTRGRPVAHWRGTVEPGRPTEVELDPADPKLGGVTRITVFEEREGGDPIPVAERLVYRQPAESLVLSVSAGASGVPNDKGPFLPGSGVELTITAADEAGRPTAAVVWAAVVNRSVLAMADEKTARLLPTHFLLAGEVQHPDDLEHADFLLTDHPQAAAALDQLLGTQGWRRFAEQHPDRLPAGPRTDQFRVSIGYRGAVPTGWRTAGRTVFDEYWPRYEGVAAELERAEADQRTGASVAGLQAELTRATAEHAGRMATFGSAAERLRFFDEGMSTRRMWLPVTLAATVGPAVLLLVLWASRRGPERRTLLTGAVGFLVLAAYVVLAVVVTGLENRWRTVAPKPQTDNRMYGGIAPAPPPAQPGPMATKAATGAAPQAAPPSVRNNDGLGQRQQFGPERGNPLQLPAQVGAEPPFRPQPPQIVSRPDPSAGAAGRLRLALAELEKRNAAPRDLLGRMQQAVPRTGPLVVREYAHKRQEPPPGADPAARTDFTETLLWQPVLVLPQDGKGTVSFELSDALTGYEVLVAGHTLTGRIGAVTRTIEVRKPVAAEAKLPQELGSADALDLPLEVTSRTEARVADLGLTLNGFKAERLPNPLTADLTPNGGGRALVRVTPTTPDGEVTVKVRAVAAGGTDTVERTARVVPDGFPHEGSKAELLEKQARAAVALPDQWVPGTLKVAVTVYPNTLAEVQNGLEGLLREPTGCFEQSSSANYPNVLITEYLRESNLANPDLSRRANGLLEKGYVKLTGFECPKTGSPTRLGYEWFGAADRPHEALTAYGLVQFADMSRVYPVDPDMLRRTRRYLLDSRDGQGGFRRNKAAIDTFGRAPGHVTNAYIVWALTESERGLGEPADLSRELAALAAQAKDGPGAKDPYFLSLYANALLNRGQRADGVAVLQTVAGMQAADGGVPGAKTSITASAGRPLVVETTAFALLGWVRANRPELFAGNVRKAMTWLSAQRGGHGAFGPTQSTVMALKALVEHAKANKKPAESGELRVSVGGVPVAKTTFTNRDPGPVVVELPAGLFKPGTTEVRVETTAEQQYPVSVAWSCRTLKPNSDPEAPVRLAAKLAKAEVVEGDSVRLDVAVENTAAAPHGMVTAVVGLPAGLRLPADLKQLKELTEKGTIAYFETRGRELVLYWRGMGPGEKVSFGLDLIADVPGEFRGPAGRAYVYYDPDHKHWADPVTVRVRPRGN